MDPRDVDPLARLWQDGWLEAHLAHVPEELTRRRTFKSFRGRLLAFGDLLRVAGPVGDPVGLCAIRNDELEQLFVAPVARGTAVAARLLKDGEARLAQSGVATAHLLCVIENERAVRFYTRQGWTNTGTVDGTVSTETGDFTFPVLRFEKSLLH